MEKKIIFAVIFLYATNEGCIGELIAGLKSWKEGKGKPFQGLLKYNGVDILNNYNYFMR